MDVPLRMKVALVQCQLTENNLQQQLASGSSFKSNSSLRYKVLTIQTTNQGQLRETNRPTCEIRVQPNGNSASRKPRWKTGGRSAKRSFSIYEHCCCESDRRVAKKSSQAFKGYTRPMTVFHSHGREKCRGVIMSAQVRACASRTRQNRNRPRSIVGAWITPWARLSFT